MSNRVPNNGDQSTPELNAQVDGGGESRHSQHQWIVQSFNEMKEDSKRMNERIDKVYTHLSDSRNDTSLACAITRMEATLTGIEKQMGALHTINQSLSEHSLQLSELSGIDKKLEKLDDIDKSVSNAKTALTVGVTIIGFISAGAWYFFGNYLAKIIEAINGLVLK
ncbi:hypothetical protein [Enterobacter asburiae]|uniref:hypothetical protein n=1 Tax=Enterobacter asburiae TaxID=61645 RepID=UPI00192A8B18|nr:hypothetical protein [Enterobacter asburiae]MBL5911255.1 hypothetical protein [Enterobacter asburiae]